MLASPHDHLVERAADILFDASRKSQSRAIIFSDDGSLSEALFRRLLNSVHRGEIGVTALAVLANLTSETKGKDTLMNLGGGDVLVSIASSAEDNGESELLAWKRAHAARTLFSISAVDKHRRALFEAGVVGCLVSRVLAMSSSHAEVANAAGCLANMSIDAGVKRAIIRAFDTGARVVELAVSFSERVKKQVTRLLFALSVDRPFGCQLWKNGTCEALVGMLNADGVSEVTAKHAIGTLGNMALCPNARRAQGTAVVSMLVTICERHTARNCFTCPVCLQSARAMFNLSLQEGMRPSVSSDAVFGAIERLSKGVMLDILNDRVHASMGHAKAFEILRYIFGLIARACVGDSNVEDADSRSEEVDASEDGSLAELRRRISRTELLDVVLKIADRACTAPYAEKCLSEAVRALFALSATPGCVPDTAVKTLFIAATTSKITKCIVHACGTLANLAREHPGAVAANDGVVLLTQLAWSTKRYDVRRQAARAIAELSIGYGDAPSCDAAGYAGRSGELSRLRHNMRNLFVHTALSEGKDGELFSPELLDASVSVWCAKRQEKRTFRLHAAILSARCVKLHEALVAKLNFQQESENVRCNVGAKPRIGGAKATVPKMLHIDLPEKYASYEVWMGFFEFIYTSSIKVWESKLPVDADPGSEDYNDWLGQLKGIAHLAADYELSTLLTGVYQLAPGICDYKKCEQASRGSSLSRDFRRLHTTVDFPGDISVWSKDGGCYNVRCHRALLAARNSYFRAMFYHEAASLCHPKRVVVDYSPNVVGVLIRYLYCGLDSYVVSELRNDVNLALETLFAASMYDAQGLRAHCEYVLAQQTMDRRNVLALLQELQLCYGHAPLLVARCLHRILLADKDGDFFRSQEGSELIKRSLSDDARTVRARAAREWGVEIDVDAPDVDAGENRSRAVSLDTDMRLC